MAGFAAPPYVQGGSQVYVQGGSLGLVMPAEPRNSLKRLPLLQRQARFDSAEWALAREGKQPTDGLCMSDQHSAGPAVPVVSRFAQSVPSTAAAGPSRMSRLCACSN